MRFGLMGPDYTPRSKFVSPEILVNRYLEVNQANQGTTQTKWSLYQRPGYFSLVNSLGGPGSAIVAAETPQTQSFDGVTPVFFAIGGGKVYQIAMAVGGGGTPVALPVQIGTISSQAIGTGGGGNFPATLIVINPQLLFIVSNGIAYVLGKEIISSSVATGGTGYANGDTGIIGQGVGAMYTVTGVSGGAVTSFTVSPVGTGYVQGSVSPTATGGTQPGSGTGFTINITATQWLQTTVAVPAGSTNYVTSATFIDNYIICTIASFQDPLRRQFYVSGLGDPTTWSTLEYATKQANPDPTVCCFAANELLFIMGSETTEIWEDTGALNFAFQRIQGGGVIETGIVAGGNTIAKVGDGTICFIGTDARGRNIAWQLNGRTPIRISNHSMEAIWYNYDTTGSNAYVAQHEGHWFYVVNFPVPDKTWVYDITSQTWAQWCYGNWQDTISAGDLARFHAVAPGVGHVVVDKVGGLYLQLTGINVDNTEPIRSIRRSPIIQSEDKRILFDRIRLYADVGGNATTTTVDCRMSYDAGNNWGNYITQTIQPGQYQTLLEWFHMGYGRYNTVEISSTGGEAWVDGYAEVRVGS